MRLIHAVRDLSARDREPDRDRRPVHRRRPRRHVRARGGPGLPPRPRLGPALPRPTPCWSARWSRPAPTRPGSAGASSPRTRRSPSCASRSASPSSGPSAEAMRKLGDKIGAKLIAEEVGVPVAPWSRGAVADPRRRRSRAAERIGYPLMLKATAGGGGRGIRVVTSRRRAARGVRAHQRRRPQRAFGSGVVFLERLVTGARHVEVQVIADGQGTAWALGVRDCSMQRRNQKIIEESASPVLAPEQVAELKASAERLARGRRLLRRGDRRVPVPPGREAVRVPRGQHPAAGRAPDHRADHRRRPGQAAAARGGRRASWTATGRPSRGTPSRRG